MHIIVFRLKSRQSKCLALKHNQLPSQWQAQMSFCTLSPSYRDACQRDSLSKKPIRLFRKVFILQWRTKLTKMQNNSGTHAWSSVVECRCHFSSFWWKQGAAEKCSGGGGKSYTNEYSIAQEWVFLFNYP